VPLQEVNHCSLSAKNFPLHRLSNQELPVLPDIVEILTKDWIAFLLSLSHRPINFHSYFSEAFGGIIMIPFQYVYLIGTVCACVQL